MSRLVTERVTKAEATQRAGRAGRVAPGVCYKLWTKGEDGALPTYPPAEIEAADLTGLALELAIWGTGPDDLAFVTAPNAAAYSEAQELLQLLGALDAEGRVTPHGRKIGAMPVHPRLAHMLARAGKEAAPLAAVLSERDPLKAASVDVSLRVAAATDLRRFKDSHPPNGWRDLWSPVLIFLSLRWQHLPIQTGLECADQVRRLGMSCPQAKGHICRKGTHWQAQK